MKYISANEILPEHLLREIQQYVQGRVLYIPAREGARKKWGQLSGQREYLNNRNSEIRQLFRKGIRMDQLSTTYCLSEDSIKKIVYSKE
ncbi:CD3324 family protein [Paenibacillus vulneris]|uniref:CD3324 family protein n=1 Tax=Paenibacillus vulneris TaxID=1133364 RepID=A0ABW3UTQ9_9BACL